MTHFFERVVGVHADAKAHAQHAFFARGEGGEHTGCGLFEVLLDRRIERQNRVLVLDEIAQL